MLERKTANISRSLIASRGIAGPVFFNAVSKSSVSSVLRSDSDSTLTYDTLSLNVGGGFDASSGTFTAPSNGIYAFMAKETSSDSRALAELVLKRNDADVIFMTPSASAENAKETKSSSVVVQLDKGDRVQIVKRTTGSTTNAPLNVEFSGYLMIPMMQ